MGRGIKKISENVIAENRSLILVSATDKATSSLDQTTDPTGVVNTPAMPLGMLNADYITRGLSMKIDQDKDKDSKATWAKLDAYYTLEQQSVVTSLIKDYNITNIKLATDSVSTEKIRNDAVTTEKIGTEQVQTRNIRDLNVTTEKLNNRAVTTEKIDNAAVTTIKIKDASVVESKLANDSVTVHKIKNQNVTEPKLADNSVSNRTIKNDAVTNSKIANGSITEWKIEDKAIHSHNIADGGVSNSNLQNACVSTEKLNDFSVTNQKIANETIIGKDKLVKYSITKDRLDPTVIDCLDRAVLHDGNGNVTGEGNSTVLNNITAKGDIYAHRVYNVVYMDIAEGYIPGEELEPGDIVAMCEDGMVRKATSIRDCIVGVVSNEYAQCFGASEEELQKDLKVAVGMIGQIHVKVKGPVRLGQRISISFSDPGIGIANWMNSGHNIGQALETIDCDFDEVHTVLVQVRPM